MRPALTLDRPPPLPMAAGRPRVVSRFRLAHVGLAALHLAQALLVLVVASDMVVDVTHQVGASATETLTSVSIGAAMAALASDRNPRRKTAGPRTSSREPRPIK